MLTRRRFTLGLATASALPLLPTKALALTLAEAKMLINTALADLQKIIRQGESPEAIVGDVEALFMRYADLNVITRSALGVAGRSASAAQKDAFAEVYLGYLSRKASRQFFDFKNATIDVTDARSVKSFYEVSTKFNIPGDGFWDVRWHVSDKSGKNLFFNVVIEGVNLLTSERIEIGNQLEKHNGDIDALIESLRRT